MPLLNKIIGFLNTNDAAKATAFYRDVLGFRLVRDDNFAVVFDANGTMIRIGKAQNHTPAQDTVLGWEVADIHAASRELSAQGVQFEQWNLPFMKQDQYGVWTTPNGDMVAWFKDPDGNVLSISTHKDR